MDKALAPVRDLTDSAQNQAVLEAASALAEGSAAAEVAASHGAAVAAEAVAAARSRRRLAELAGLAVHGPHHGQVDRPGQLGQPPP